MPGIRIISPMTPKEYTNAYNEFMNSDQVFYISEHRKSYDVNEELNNIIQRSPDFTIFAISITRLAAINVSKMAKKEGIIVNVVHVVNIKPFLINDDAIKSLKSSKLGGIILDDDYVDGMAKTIALDLNHLSGKKVNVLGLENKSAGFYPNVDNLPPNEKKILDFIKTIVNKNV